MQGGARHSVLARAYRALAERGQALLHWARNWWGLLFIAAQVIVLATFMGGLAIVAIEDEDEAEEE